MLVTSALTATCLALTAQHVAEEIPRPDSPAHSRLHVCLLHMSGFLITLTCMYGLCPQKKRGPSTCGPIPAPTQSRSSDSHHISRCAPFTVRGKDRVCSSLALWAPACLLTFPGRYPQRRHIPAARGRAWASSAPTLFCDLLERHCPPPSYVSFRGKS